MKVKSIKNRPENNNFLHVKCCETCKYCTKQPIKTSAVEYRCNYPKHEGETFLFDSCPDYAHKETPKGVYTYASITVEDE